MQSLNSNLSDEINVDQIRALRSEVQRSGYKYAADVCTSAINGNPFAWSVLVEVIGSIDPLDALINVGSPR